MGVLLVGVEFFAAPRQFYGIFQAVCGGISECTEEQFKDLPAPSDVKILPRVAHLDQGGRHFQIHFFCLAARAVLAVVYGVCLGYDSCQETMVGSAVDIVVIFSVVSETG